MSIEDPHRVFTPDDLDIAPVVAGAPERSVCPVNGLELNYLVWGDRAKPPVVLVHGGKDHCRNWDWTVAELIHDYCLITPDLRGHGDSGRATGGGYDGYVFVSDFYAFMEHLAAEGFARPVALVGHSLGGSIVLTYSAIAPENVSRVIAMEGLGVSPKLYKERTAAPLHERLRHWTDQRAKADGRPLKRFRDPEELVTRMAGVHRNLSKEQARHLALHAARKFPDGWGWKHDDFFGFFPGPTITSPEDNASLHENIQCPVLLMRGCDSWASDPVEDGRIKAFREARLINYEGASHWLHHDAFDACIADVKQFLAE